MVNTSVVLPHAPRTGQATAVEQSRATAEVLGAIEGAQRWPRDVQAAIVARDESCRMAALADRAFFKFPRSGTTVQGPSVYLARELARCWGNIQYGVAEMSRDDEHGQSEMLAYAWDVQANTRNSAVFIVPHKRDKQTGPVKLVDMRDIYESNANAGARRVRECILAVLPLWFVEEAKDLCRKTLADGGGKPLPQRIADAITAFAALGISEERLVAKVGSPLARWTEIDVANLVVTYNSIKRGEVTREEEFPSTPVTVEEIVATRSPPPVVATPGPEVGHDLVAATAAEQAKARDESAQLNVSSEETPPEDAEGVSEPGEGDAVEGFLSRALNADASRADLLALHGEVKAAGLLGVQLGREREERYGHPAALTLGELIVACGKAANGNSSTQESSSAQRQEFAADDEQPQRTPVTMEHLLTKDRRGLERHLFPLLAEGGITDTKQGRETRLLVVSRLTNSVPRLTTLDDLPDEKLMGVIITLDEYRCESAERLIQELAELTKPVRES